MVKNITKYAVYLEKEQDIKYELEKAFFIAHEGRKGPVLIDIPYDIQRKDIDIKGLKSFKESNITIYENKTEEFYKLLKNAKRPLIIAGGGCQYAKKELRDFLKLNGIPIVVSMRGLDLIPHDNENYIGFLGSYGNRVSNIAVKYSDLLIVLGSRLDERQMGYKKNEFSPNAKIIQVDIDKFELGRKVDCELLIKSGIKTFLDNIISTKRISVFSDWIKLLKVFKREFSPFDNSKHCISNIVNYISELSDSNAVISVDVGQNQIISSQVINMKEGQQFLSSSGLACMGYSLPAAIGAYYADRKRQIISINGDGGLQMNIQELETISRNKIPVKIFVMHNNCLGLIRKLQENLFEKRYYASVQGFSCPDLEKIAYAYNLGYLKIENLNNYKEVNNILKEDKSYLIDVILPIEADAIPEPGKSISEQLPIINSEIIKNFERQIKDIAL